MSVTPKSLLRAREQIDPLLGAALRTLSPDLERVAGYHMGFLDASGAPATAPRGKALRPALALLSAAAVGADPERGAAAAAALELVHDFTLLHDDVMDGDEERRHRPTAWVEFGVGPAICAGDALVLLARQVLTSDESPARYAAADRLDQSAVEVIAGQARDLALEGRIGVSPAEYIEMAEAKTGALLGCAASLGAVLAGAEPETIRHLDAFGRSLGLAFQAADDWLGVWGDPARTGKPVANDLRQRKAALPLVLALASDTAAGRELERLFAAPGEDRDEEVVIVRALELMEESGAPAATRAEAHRRLEDARTHLDAAGAEPNAHAEMLELAEFVVTRDF